MLAGCKTYRTCCSDLFSRAFGSEKATERSKFLVFLRLGNEYQQLCISAKANVGDLRRAVGKKKRMSSRLIIIRLGGKVLRDDFASLESAGLVAGSTVHCDLLALCGCGFSSIPVENLKPLLNAIKVDYESWAASQKQCNKVWSGLSNDVQAYFKAEKINPTEKYSQFYSKCRHSIATSYVWSVIGLFQMAG